MKKITFIALAAAFAAVALAQTKSPKEIYKQITDFENNAYEQAFKSHEKDAYRKIQDQVHQMVADAVKGVDPAKVDPKDAYDWAKIYAMMEDHKTVCVLTHAFLTSHPSAEEKFQDQALMMQSCSALGEADMLKQTVTSVKPVTSDDNISLAYSAPEFVDTIAAKQGDAEGLRVLERVQREIKLPDPDKAAEQQLEAEKKLAAGTPKVVASGSSIAIRMDGGKEPSSDKDKLAECKKGAISTNQQIELGFAEEKAKLLQGEGKKDKALEALEEYGKTPDLGKGVKHELDMTVNQIKLTGSPEVELKFDKTIGTFSSLGAMKGKVVLVDFFAHWCGPCMASIPSLVSTYTQLHPVGLEIVGVTQFYGFFGQDKGLAQDQEFAKLQGLISDKGMTWPVLVGPKDNSSAYGVYGIPETVLIDKKGLVRQIFVGYSPEIEEKVKATVVKMLAE